MRIKDIGGESGLIHRIAATFVASNPTTAGLVLGIGDDCAIIAPQRSQTLVTTDMLVEGVHFRRDWSDFYSIGWKAAAVNLSDIASMGGRPTFAFLSLACPSQEPVENIDRFYDGFADCLTRYGAHLAGGDTNSTPNNFVVSVTQMGEVEPGKALVRTGAKCGDKVLVTGSLGGSAAGLSLLAEMGLPRAEKLGKDLVTLHRRPRPRIVAGRAALGTGKVHAAMDLSDGLQIDLQKLCLASGVGAVIDAAAIPIDENVRRIATVLRKDVLQWALTGGEDYELLLCVAPEDTPAVIDVLDTAGARTAIVGEIARTGIRVQDENGETIPVATCGWDHFADE